VFFYSPVRNVKSLIKTLTLRVIVIEPSQTQYMFHRHKQINRMYAIVAKQCLSIHCVIKKTLKLDCFLVNFWASRRKDAYHGHINAFNSNLYKNKNLRCSFKATAQAKDKGIHSFCCTAEISARHFCDGLEMKYTPPLGRIQQAGTPEPSAQSGTPCFY